MSSKNEARFLRGVLLASLVIAGAVLALGAHAETVTDLPEFRGKIRGILEHWKNSGVSAADLRVVFRAEERPESSEGANPELDQYNALYGMQPSAEGPCRFDSGRNEGEIDPAVEKLSEPDLRRCLARMVSQRAYDEIEEVWRKRTEEPEFVLLRGGKAAFASVESGKLVSPGSRVLWCEFASRELAAVVPAVARASASTRELASAEGEDPGSRSSDDEIRGLLGLSKQ